jgi:hypothetical protein
MGRHLVLESVKPDAIGAAILQEPLPFAQRPLVGRGGGAVLGRKRKGQSIEKTAAITGRARKQPIHRRRDPRKTQERGDFGPGRGAPIKASDALETSIGAALGGGGQRAPLAVEHRFGENHPGPRAVQSARRARHIGEPRPTQPSPRRQRRHGFKNIRLARPVRADEADWPLIQGQPQICVAAEIRQPQVCKPKPRRHTRSGIST